MRIGVRLHVPEWVFVPPIESQAGPREPARCSLDYQSRCVRQGDLYAHLFRGHYTRCIRTKNGSRPNGEPYKLFKMLKLSTAAQLTTQVTTDLVVTAYRPCRCDEVVHSSAVFRMKLRLLIMAAMVLAGCVPYADFTLPVLSGGAQPTWKLTNVAPPIISRGTAGQFDSIDVLNPSVIRHGSELWNYYSGFDGKTWHTGLATSIDGLVWQKKGKILSPDPQTWEGDYIAANGSAIQWNGEIFYYYQGNSTPQIGLARSKDGLSFTKLPQPVLPVGPRGSWDERGAADPYVITLNGKLYLYYLGQDRARRQRLGVAVSDDGISWKKLRSNPLLELGEAGSFDEKGLGEPAVWVSGGNYFMLYTGRDKTEHRRMGIAISQDGVHWKKSNAAPFSGESAWNKDVICDATVLIENGQVRVWFGGGDKTEPAERLNGQITAAILAP